MILGNILWNGKENGPRRIGAADTSAQQGGCSFFFLFPSQRCSWKRSGEGNPLFFIHFAKFRSSSKIAGMNSLRNAISQGAAGDSWVILICHLHFSSPALLYSATHYMLKRPKQVRSVTPLTSAYPSRRIPSIGHTLIPPRIPRLPPRLTLQH